MYQRTTLKIVDDINVVVPDSLNLITTYVLVEQRDWFEDEIKFVRILLKPGQRAIDIGANYGLFTLSMAKVVGAEGAIWAFEPASSTASYLADSLRVNGFSQVTLDQRALSFQSGTAKLTLNDNSELNELVRDGAAVGMAETVTLTSLDEAMIQYDWHDIDFVKIDAEGEEGAIIRGGKKFFDALSPLIQYEVKAGNTVHLELVHEFANIGYSSYRLLPGLGVLVPFVAGEPVDGYLLNLFCCKPDRAAKLAVDRRLVLADSATEGLGELSDEILNNLVLDPRYGWETKLAKLPYGALLCANWRNTVAQGQSVEVLKALALYAIAHDANLPLPQCVRALSLSLKILTDVCKTGNQYLRYLSLARVARECGCRVDAVAALDKLYQSVIAAKEVNPSEPFLASNARFDQLSPNNAMGNWVLGSILEELETNSYFSSFYAGEAGRSRLEMIDRLNFGSAEMTRRLDLVQRRFPKVASPG